MLIPPIKWLPLLIVLIAVGGIAPPINADDAKPENPPPRPVTRLHDIRAWTAPLYDLSLDSSPHSAGFVTPADLPSETFDYAATGQRFPSRNRREFPSRAERVEGLAKLITDTVDPESWRDNGGTIGAIREIHDVLVVTQTPENHAQIASLLRQLKERKSETVRTTAEWIILSRAEVNRILKPRAGHEKDKRVALEVDPAALAKISAATPRIHADLLCLNGQTVSFVSGREKTVTVKQIGVVGTAVSAYQPLVGNSGSGIALQIHPVVDREQKTAVMTLFSTFNDADKPSAPIAVRSVATTQASNGQRVAASETSGTYRELNGVVQEFRTTLRMHLGVPVLAGAMTLEPNSKNAEAKELVLILTVQSAE